MRHPERGLKSRGVGRWLAAVSLAVLPAMAQTTSEDLRITIGKSVVVDYPTDVNRISTSDPAIVDAVAVSTREILLHAKGHGAASVVVWAKTGQRTFYNVTVEHNLEPMRRVLKESFPGEDIRVQAARDSVTLTGQISAPAVGERAVALAASLAKTVINNMQVTPMAVDKQVMLRVKFAELNRNAASSFGVNLLSTGALNTIGRTTTGQFSAPGPTSLSGSIPGQIAGTTSQFTITDALNVFAFRPDLNLSGFIRALQTEGVLQILAEPNLVTTNGKEASFLVGGEFPVPVLQGGANSGAVTIQFREFGIRLRFNPVITGNDTIKMFVLPEVSTIDLANAVSFSGFTIPALATRRMETNIELSHGQSFVIAGLIDDRVNDTMSKLPGLSSIPILGALFKSRSEAKTRTELIVLVTPEVVRPLNPGDASPVPYMPKDFLVPLKPAPAGAPAAAVSGKKTAAAQAAQGAANP